MPTPAPIEYKDAPPAVRAAFGNVIYRKSSIPDLRCALDPLTKEIVYLAVSVTNGCANCIAGHTVTARKAGTSEAMFGELVAVTGMANETSRLANGYRVPVDAMFET